MDVRQLIQDARDAYNAAGKPPIVIPDNYEHRDDTIRMSAIDSCELEHAFSKAGVPMSNEETMNYHLFDSGDAMAEIFQKALTWHAGQQVGIAFSAEQNVYVEMLHAFGRYDGLLTYQELVPVTNEMINKQTIIELKNTEGFIKRSVGEPKASYAYQCIGYMMATGATEAAIVTASRWQWQVYYVRPIAIGSTQYQVYTENGEIYNPPKWAGDWNTPEHLSIETMYGRSKIMRHYIDYVNKWLADDTLPHPRTKRPIDNALNHDRDNIWCTRTLDKGRKTKPARPKTVTPACAYFDICWPDTLYTDEDETIIEVIKDDDGNEYMNGYEPVQEATCETCGNVSEGDLNSGMCPKCYYNVMGNDKP